MEKMADAVNQNSDDWIITRRLAHQTLASVCMRMLKTAVARLVIDFIWRPRRNRTGDSVVMNRQQDCPRKAQAAEGIAWVYSSWDLF
jgi:hypothetical protein